MWRELYLATDISTLDKIARDTFDQMKNLKLTQAYRAADKLEKNINLDLADGEKTYIYMTRYLLMLDYIYKIDKDRHFLELRYDTPRRVLMDRHSVLKGILINRYKALSAATNAVKVDKVNVEAPLDIFGSDKFITCQQLYEAKCACLNLLIMDVRAIAEYENSHLKEFTCINIDEKLVIPGLSAHKLGEILPNNVKEVYDKRSTFDYIIIMDLDTTQETYMMSKLRVLYLILTEWDFNTIYKHVPYLLKGGYIDFIERYPTFSTNANIILKQKYEELDELLDLDVIQYPDEFASAKEDSNRLNTEINSLYKDILEYSNDILRLEEQIFNRQKKFYDPANASMKNIIETDITQLTATKLELYKKKGSLNTKLQSLLDKSPTDNIQTKSDLRNIEHKIVNVSRQCRKLMEAHRIITEEAAALPDVGPYAGPSSSTTSDTSSAQVGARTARPGIPTVNRSTKPKTPPRTSENLGLVGLTNRRNTCYMNSIIQCIRHLPSIKRYFLSGQFEREITTPEPSLILELGDLITKLWTTSSKSINPAEFYKKATTLNPIYRHGNHEDANEFFMFVYDHILADTAYAVARDKYAEAKIQTLYDRLQYKDSFFVKAFYHQIRTDCICGGCRKKCLKYDIENVLMLGVPPRGNCCIEEMFEKFMHTCDISDYYCRKCERKGDIFREFSFQPKIIAFLLKRYTYGRGVAEKITVPCDFPTDNFRIGRATYKLWAVSLHQGGMEAGHYTAVCLNSEDGNWYEYNDEYVRPANIYSPSIKEKIYMLFYESEDGSDEGFSTRK
ncbi:hypothetical protein Trydic_g10733 [Trypoxylus dichotomus]